ncbi:hypothetical protein ACFL4Q_05090 [candidate division KSB1 bacterium]
MNTVKVQKVLSDFIIEEYQKHPFDYLYEFEIQAILYSMLKNKINDRIHHTFETNNQKTFSKVKAEYHPLSNMRLDIAILEKDEISEINDKIHNRSVDVDEMVLYWQKIDIGIEIKLQAIFTDQILGFNNDISKLQELMDYTRNSTENSINTGIALLFFHKDKDFRKIKDGEFVQNFISLGKKDDIISIIIEENELNAIIITPEEVLFCSKLPSE